MTYAKYLHEFPIPLWISPPSSKVAPIGLHDGTILIHL